MENRFGPRELWDWIAASDPGLTRLLKACRITAAIICAVMTMLALVALLPHGQTTAAMLAGMVSLIGSMAVNDDTPRLQKQTTCMLAIPAVVSVVLGAVFSPFKVIVDVVLVAVVFLAFYLQRWGPRYTVIGMLGFMSLYFSNLLHVQFKQLPWFLAAIVVGLFYAYAFHFWILKDHPESIVQRLVKDFRGRANAVLGLVIDSKPGELNSKQGRIHLQQAVARMHECSTMVTGLLGVMDSSVEFEGMQKYQLRLYLFDTEMMIETLIGAAQRLEEGHVFERDEVRDSVLVVLRSVRDLVIHHQDASQVNRVRGTLRTLRSEIDTLIATHTAQEWLFLFRRIESIVEHLVDEVTETQRVRLQSLRDGREVDADGVACQRVDKGSTEARDVESSINPFRQTEGLQTSTKDAIRAVVAAAPCIVIGQFLSPSHAYWMLLSSFVVLIGTGTVGRTFVKSLQRVLGTLLGAILGYGLATLAAGDIYLEISFIFLCVFMAFYLVLVSYAWMVLFITMMLSLMYGLLLGSLHVQLLESRVVDTVIGVVFGWGASAFIFRNRSLDEIQDAMATFLSHFKVFVVNYIESYVTAEETSPLTNQVFELEQQLETIHEAARTFRKMPGAQSRGEIERKLLVLEELNYYSRHLEHSEPFQRQIPSQIVVDTLSDVKRRIESNVSTLCQLIGGKAGVHVYDLEKERACIEQLAGYLDSQNVGSNVTAIQRDALIRDLYYVWRINRAIVKLSIDLGAEIEKFSY